MPRNTADPGTEAGPRLLSRKVTAVFGGATVDAFGRQRVSTPRTQLDYKQLYDALPLLYDDAEVSGGSTGSSYNTNRASTSITVEGDVAGKRVRQSKTRGVYQPGKGLLVLITGVIAPTTGNLVYRRWGYFDGNNGLFFTENNGALFVTRRTYISGSAVDTNVAQASWNIDPMDGTGPSGVTLDISKANIYVIDFEWLGVGGVRFGVVVDNNIYYVHQLYNANSLTSVYMQNPNLPIRYEIQSFGLADAETFSLETICASIISEGGDDNISRTTVFTRGTTSITLPAAGTYAPLVSVRLRSGRLYTRVVPKDVSVFLSSSTDYHWKLVLNPTIGGTDAATWALAPTNSSVDGDIARTNANTVSGGEEIDDGYGSSSVQGKSVVANAIESFLGLGSTIAGVSDELVLCATPLTGSGGTAYGSIVVEERV